MIVLHVTFLNLKRANGLRYSVPGIVSAQHKINGVQSALLNISEKEYLIGEDYKTYDFPFFTNFKNIKSLPEPFNRPDIVIFQNLYLPDYLKLYKELECPYIIVPRVAMTRGAQQKKWLKKKIANKFLFNKFISNAKSIHYLTDNEKKESNNFKNKSFVVGNGIDLPNNDILHKNVNSNEIILSFIGRLDIEHKGLDLLIESVYLIKDELINNNVKINIYGPDFEDNLEKIKILINKHELTSIIILKGSVYGDEKKAALLKTDIFIAPSRFEGHPQAVLEAMSYEIPCILTPGTNMQKITQKYDAGWNSKFNNKELSETILDAISSKNILQKGINARKLVEENYTWNRVAKMTIEKYRSLM